MSSKRKVLGEVIEAVFNSTATILDLIQKVSAGHPQHKHEHKEGK